MPDIIFNEFEMLFVWSLHKVLYSYKVLFFCFSYKSIVMTSTIY